ncbi:DUF4158 domain-containing protein [Nocardiopsis sp. ARC36]
MKEVEAKELETYPLARAMEHDSPTALFRAACAHLRSACVIRPGPVWQHAGPNRGAAARTSTSAAAPTSAHAGADTVSPW